MADERAGACEAACAECSSLERIATTCGLAKLTKCRACGAEFDACEPAPGATLAIAKPVATTRLRAVPENENRRLRAFVGDVLLYVTTIERVERASGISTSTLGWLDAALLTPDGKRLVLGSGCSGTKGVGHAPPRDDPPPAKVDPTLHARWMRMHGQSLRSAEAVAADGRGDQIVALQVEGRGKTTEIAATLEQRIGLAIADAEQVKRWWRKLASGDSAPALRGAADLGGRALKKAADDWFVPLV
jgi:hypothetical protein